jgi:hypothetical protein
MLSRIKGRQTGPAACVVGEVERGLGHYGLKKKEITKNDKVKRV